MKRTIVVYLLLILSAVLDQACGKATSPDSSAQSGSFPSDLQFQQPAALK